jgi:polyisoprenoid-binding protein YceI
VDEPNLKGHLLSPEFFDSSRHPELRFAADALRVEGSTIDVDGTLTIKGITKPVRLTGTVTGPVADAYGGTRYGVELETTVDRREFGLDWNAPLPGGGLTVANEVTITGELELVQADA